MVDLTAKYVDNNNTGYNPNLLFLHNEFKNYRYFVMQGGTRSGKTFATLQFLWRNLNAYTGVRYSVVRATLNALKATTLVDFVEIGQEAGLYTQNRHNLTNNIYKHKGNVVDFFASDDDEKVRGRKRDVLYINEAPEVNWEIVKQFQFRTTSKIIIDYNPSYPESWVYDKILTRDDCAFIRTTYKDNPHLTQGQLDEIEWMRVNDPDSYLVYGLGERGQLKGQVFKHFQRIQSLPELASSWVIDFGFANDPACIAEFRKEKRAIYCRERLYKTGQDNLDIAIHIFFAGANLKDLFIADSAEPKSIAEFRRGWGLDKQYLQNRLTVLGYSLDRTDELLKYLKSGFMVMPAKKGVDSIDAGIQKVKQMEVFITDDSHNAWSESRMYRWAEDPKTGELLNKPIDKHNHFCDCLRMFCMAEGVYH